MNPVAELRAEALLQRLATAPEFQHVSVLVEDSKLILEGCVESYARKVQVEDIGRETGFTDIDNCLRVHPCDQEAPADAQG